MILSFIPISSVQSNASYKRESLRAILNLFSQVSQSAFMLSLESVVRIVLYSLSERCRSGRTGRSRKPLCLLQVPRVRIPPSPLEKRCVRQQKARIFIRAFYMVQLLPFFLYGYVLVLLPSNSCRHVSSNDLTKRISSPLGFRRIIDLLRKVRRVICLTSLLS